MEILAALALVVAVLALALALAALRRTASRGGTGVDALPEDVHGLRQEVAALRSEGADALRHLAVVRYDAFGDMGGHLSWSVALLDDGGDGVVLTSIHGRSEARTYAKAISGWTCEQQLSPEELEAIERAPVSKPAKPSKTPPLLRVRGLTKKFGDVEVLSGVDLTVTAGKALALRGRNGAGKSTLLRCVTGVDAPTSGTVELDGEQVDERSVRVRRDLAIVLDDMDFFPDLSVVEHLDVFARAHGVPDAEQVVDEVLEEVRLTPRPPSFPGTLSSGQKRRLALASAFVRPRRLLVLDEPEARLDQAGLVWLTERLLREKAAGLGILLASHDPDLVKAVADRVLDLDAFHVSASAAEVRALRSQIRTWRRGRVDTSLMEALSDAYVAVFSALVLGAMAVNVIINVHVITSGGCSSVSCLDARDALGWLFGLAAVTLVLAAARLLGPMLVTPAVGTWLLTTPLDRTALVRGRLLTTAVVAAGVGAALAATGATLSAYPVNVIGWLTLLAGVVCVLLVGVATVDQAREGPVVRLLAWSLGVVLWVGLVLVARDSVPALLRVPAVAPLRVAVVVTAVAGAVLLVLAYRSLHLIRRERLVSGGSLLPGISGALASLDLTLFYDILVARHWRARSSVRVVRGRGTGASALVWREVVRLRRTPQVLVALVGALVLPYLATALGLGHLMVLVVTLTGFVAGVGLFTSLRVLSRTASLLRCFPLPASAVRGACLGVPGAVLVLWGLAATPAVHDAIGGAWTTSAAVALACGVVSATAAVRWMTSRPPDYRLPLITSPMGAVPTSLYFSVLRGFDVLVFGTVPLLVAPTTNGAAVSMALMAAVLSFLVSRP